jgi:hypothetical protein
MAVINTGGGDPIDECEANLFLIAAVVTEPSYPDQSDVLRAAAMQHFERTGTRWLGVDEAFARGWIIGLPRLRDSLTVRLQRAGYRSSFRLVSELRADRRGTKPGK